MKKEDGNLTRYCVNQFRFTISKETGVYKTYTLSDWTSETTSFVTPDQRSFPRYYVFETKEEALRELKVLIDSKLFMIKDNIRRLKEEKKDLKSKLEEAWYVK